MDPRRSTDFLVPPKQIEHAGGTLHLPPEPIASNPDRWAETALRRLNARPGEASDADILIRENPSVDGIDGYRATVSPERVLVEARDEAGARAGLAALRELRTARGNTLPGCTITDSADFARRGMYLDCSRGKVPTIQTIRELVDHLAAWRINELQLYVKNVFAFRAYPEIGDGFDPLTPDDIRDLQTYCAERGVRFVGSMAGFSHMEPILALPRFQHLGELQGTHDCPGGTTLCPIDPGAIQLLRELYAEFVPLFAERDFNVCGDEPWELGRGRSAERANQVGTGRLYADFMKQMHDIVAGEHGKRMNMWGDVVCQHPEALADFPRDVVMLNWDYAPEGNRFGFSTNIREAGFPLMICPGTNSWQTHGGRPERAMQNIRRFADVGREAGAEGLLNTDWGDCGHRNPLAVSLHGLAYGAACAWNAEGVDDPSFPATFAKHVFGIDDAEFATALFRLGKGCPSTPTALYHALPAPVNPENDFLEAIEPRSPVRVNARRAAVRLEAIVDHELEQAAALWEAPPFEHNWANATEHDFALAVLRELDLAARMDRLAAHKVLLTRRFRAGERVLPAERQELADAIDSLADTFRDLWLARNRPCRLEDNLTLLHAATQELRSLD